MTGASPGRDGGDHDTTTTPSPGTHPTRDGADGGTVTRVKAAVTTLACDIDTTHVPVPVQPAPDHPANTDPVAGVAVSVTDEPKA